MADAQSLTTRRFRRATAITVVVLVAVAAGGAASAYFRGVGTGAGAGLTGTSATSLTLTSGAAAEDLYPGGAGTVTANLSNSGDSSVRVSSLQLDTARGTSGFAVDSAHSACPLSAFAFTTQTNGSDGWEVDAGRSTPVRMTGSLSLAASAPDSCQGAAITVYLRAGS